MIQSAAVRAEQEKRSWPAQKPLLLRGVSFAVVLADYGPGLLE